MTQEEMLKIKSEMDKAQESTTPFALVNEDNLAVVGDANDTKTVLSDYTITFRLPDGKGGSVEKDVEYKSVFITPRQETRLARLYAELLPFFKKFEDSGEVTDYDESELVYIAQTLTEEMLDLMYDLVGYVLGVDPELMDYMTIQSVVPAVAQIIRQYPQQF